ncbi:MAG: phosphoribosyltransferase family protein [Saprospiraceae bacterium]
MNTIRKYIDALIDVFFPVFCLNCDRNCDNPKELFCFRCQSIQAPTDLHLRKENEFTDHFRGRLTIHTAASLYYYTPGGVIHKLLEQIKYRSKPQLAERIGHYYGSILASSPLYKDIDLILPVPLHPSKLALRGYNQSQVFGRAISEELGREMNTQILVRIKESNSQTEKNRMERMNNIFNAFSLLKYESVKNKNILIIDDVMTTGATLEACALEVLKGSPQSISFVTIALGKY